MSDTFIFNVALGWIGDFANISGSETLKIVLLQDDGVDTPEDPETMRAHSTLAALLAVTGNTEANFDNYARKVAANVNTSLDTSVFPAVLRITFDPVQWASAGGTTDNDIIRLLVCYDPNDSADSAIVPLSCHTWKLTTIGTEITAIPTPAGVQTASSPEGA